MARYKEVDYRQSLLLAVNYSEQILEGTFEYTLCYLFDNDKVDTTIFDKKYSNDKTGRKAILPSVLLKIVLLAYSRGIFSSRRIERLCIENILFKSVSANTCPDHSTLANFISSLDVEIQNIFVDVLLICNELKLIGGEVFALDGHKVSSNASKEWSGTISDLEKKKEKFETMMNLLLKKHKETDVEEEKQNYKTRIKKYNQKIQRIISFIQSNEPKKGRRIKEVQSNITDNESARMKSSHGIIQGYTGEAVVDSKNQIIVYAEAFGDGQEQEYVDDMVIGTEKTMMEVFQRDNYLEGKIFLADNGNFSETNLEFLESKKIDAYIPDNAYRKRDPRYVTYQRHKKKPSPAEDKSFYRIDKFQYDSKNDTFTCPKGVILKRSRNEGLIKGRYLGKRYVAPRTSCMKCELREKCLRNKSAKFKTLLTLRSIPNQKSFTEKMREKIDSKEGREIYSRRMGIIEPVFANIRFQKRLNYFTLRTKQKVNIQWNLFSLIHNIEKIRKFI